MILKAWSLQSVKVWRFDGRFNQGSSFEALEVWRLESYKVWNGRRLEVWMHTHHVYTGRAQSVKLINGVNWSFGDCEMLQLPSAYTLKWFNLQNLKSGIIKVWYGCSLRACGFERGTVRMLVCLGFQIWIIRMVSTFGRLSFEVYIYIYIYI